MFCSIRARWGAGGRGGARAARDHIESVKDPSPRGRQSVGATERCRGSTIAAATVFAMSGSKTLGTM